MPCVVDLITIQETCRILGIGPRQLRNLRLRGDLVGLKNNYTGAVRFDRKAVLRLKNERDQYVSEKKMRA
jgi:Helix-turn-helix domain